MTEYDTEQTNNLEQFEVMLKNVSPELHSIYVAINQTTVPVKIITEFVYQLNNVMVEKRGRGRAIVEVVEGTCRFVKTEKKLLVEDWNEE